MRDFRLYLNVLLVATIFAFPTHLNAQSSDDAYENLKQQVDALQTKLEEASNHNQENPFGDDKRVRDVGRQIIRRRREEDNNDIALQIRLYDLSDLFAASPSYPAKLPKELEPGSSLFANSPAQIRGSGGGGFGGGAGGGMGGGGGVF